MEFTLQSLKSEALEHPSDMWARPAQVLRRTGVLLLFLLALFATSCDLFDDDDTVTIEGTVQFSEIEGGCWTILATDSTQYEPINLAQEFKIHGLNVRVEGRLRRDLASICQLGLIMEVQRITELRSRSMGP